MTASSRYANALFALATEGKQQDTVTQAVTALQAGIAEESVAAALANPLLSASQRASFATSMAKAVKAPAPLANTLGLLAKSNRLALVPEVLSHYLELNDTAAGITHVRVSSAAPLTDAQRTQISELIKKHTKSSGIRLDETVDASLQGGFRAFFGGKVWDASLAGQLARLSTRLRAAIAQSHKQ
ncbi:MAG: ATP synthase F1 subunit delta [Pseudomonas fluorescens]|nr:MAG: ATP synthase F1 subunit delta [Pseudomonas fluorescens]